MKKESLKLIIALVFIGGAVGAILNYSNAIESLKAENDELKKLLNSKPASASKRNLNHSGNPTPNVTANLSEENSRLNNELNQMREALAEVKNNETALKEQVNELLKPLKEDILSSTLKAIVGKNEILVTGGYQTADGKFQYAMVEPALEQLADGHEAIRIQTRQYAMTPEVMKEFGLDSLSSNAGNTLQHGEVWTAEKLRSLNEIIASRGEVDLITSPQITVLPGRKAEIMVGEYRMSTTPRISADGSGFDLELRIEQPRDPGGKAQQGGSGQQR